MKPIAIDTLSLCVALLCLSESFSQLAQEHNLPDPAMSSSATFHHFVCCGCYECAPGSNSNSCFSSYKAVTTHIGRSILCVREGKGVQTVTMAYRPSGRAEDQEAGAVGGAGTWPVRPAAAPAAPTVPGKPYRTSHRMVYDVVCAYRIQNTISYNSDAHDVVLRHHIMLTYTYDMVCDIV
jgi:hypothetical protein